MVILVCTALGDHRLWCSQLLVITAAGYCSGIQDGGKNRVCPVRLLPCSGILDGGKSRVCPVSLLPCSTGSLRAATWIQLATEGGWQAYTGQARKFLDPGPRLYHYVMTPMGSHEGSWAILFWRFEGIGSRYLVCPTGKSRLSLRLLGPARH